MNWIRTTDQLPPERLLVLGVFGKHVTITHRVNTRGNAWHWHGFNGSMPQSAISHWAEMPPLPVD